MKNKFIVLNQGVAEIHLIEEKDMSLDRMYELLNCDMVDVVRASEDIDFWVDDEGLLKSGNYVHEIKFEENVFTLAGKILVLKRDEDGDQVGLDDNEVENIIDNFRVRLVGFAR